MINLAKAFDSVVVFPYEPVSSLNISIKNMTVEIPNVFSIIENLSLELTPGTNLIIKGKNGSGKTTLFNALTNLSIPKSGSSTIPQFPNTLVMPQKLYLPCIASISEIVGYGCSCRGVCGKGCMGFKSFSSSEITRVLNEVGLAYLPRQVTSIDSSKSLFEKFKLDVLSNGEVQRLYIARILLWKPSWAFIDEGLSAVDSSGRMLLYGLLRKADVSLVIIDHHLDESLDGKWTSIVLNKA